MAGTIISTAVLTGALVVGDSVRYSLEQLTDTRLGKAHFAVQSGDRFFRQQLATELAAKTKSVAAPLLQLEGIALNSDKNTLIKRVEVLGIDTNFMKLWDFPAITLKSDEAILSRSTAGKLNLKTGDEFLLKVRKQSKASENAPFISEKELLVGFRVKVGKISDDVSMGRFSLKSNQSAPYNIFVPIETLARKIGLVGNANLILITENSEKSLSAQKLDSLLHLSWQAEDAGLVFSKLADENVYEIKSDRIFIGDNTAKVIEHTIPGANPFFTYLVNDITAKGKSTPYSFVTATDIAGLQLAEREIIINRWLATDLSAGVGDSIQLKYFRMGALRKLIEDSARFSVKFILPISDPLFDRTLMPEFPGMSDAGNCREWETGAPVNLDKIRDKDEQYWNDYRGTPKAFISLSTGRKLWDNAFGHATAFRFLSDGDTLKTLKQKVADRLLPGQNGLLIKDVYTEGKLAASHSTDFGSLFLSLSFFIIVAAILLTSLLFSLHAQNRKTETATLAAVGFRKNIIIRILVIETSMVVITGSILGVFGGILYNKLLLLGLNTLWNDAVRTSLLQMQLLPETLIAGFAAGMITSILTLLIVLRQNLRKPLSSLVKGEIIPMAALNYRHKKISLTVAILLFSASAGIFFYSFRTSQSDLSALFLSAGGLIMAGSIVFLYFMLLRANSIQSESLPRFFTLILRNAGMKKRRTISAVTLLAIGTFSVIITGANRKSFYGSENNVQSGTGGFLAWAESTVPVMNDLNLPEGKTKYGLTDEPALRDVKFVQMLRLTGNDASCLNLNQVSAPVILAVNPQYFDQKQSFSFIKLDVAADSKHPWLTLNKQLAAGVIPGYADQTVIQWGMHKSVGDTILYTDESGRILKVKIMGGLDNSIFQGNILVSGELFRHYFPSAGGSRVMLIDGNLAQRSVILNRLEYLFQDFGMQATPASERLAQFNSVENTYLSVFMLLGGLGVILGTFGLGIVIMRNIKERKQEIALYQVIGFKRNFVYKMLASEYLLILFLGIFTGTFSAAIGILPSALQSVNILPFGLIASIIMALIISGILWIFIPINGILKSNLVQALRSE